MIFQTTVAAALTVAGAGRWSVIVKEIAAFDFTATPINEGLVKETDGSVSAALRRLIYEVVDSQQDSSQQITVQDSGPGKQVNIRLRDAERQALAAATQARSKSPAN